MLNAFLPIDRHHLDPDTDKRVLVTDFTNPTQGQTMGFIDDLALDHFGKILISPEGAEFTSGSALFQVNPQTGQRKLVSDFSNQAQGVFALFNSFKGLAGTSGRIQRMRALALHANLDS